MSAVSSKLRNSSAFGSSVPGTKIGFDRLYQILEDNYPFDPSWPDGNWPVRGGFHPEWLEVAVGAVLTQNTRWENVEITLDHLRTAGLVNLPAFMAASDLDLQAAVRSSGFYRQKAGTLRRLSRLFLALDGRPISRAQLLSLKGVGPETADSIMLYALGRPEFVVDAYTRRFLERMGLFRSGDSYDQLKSAFEDQLRADVPLFRRYHALIVSHGKRHCRRRPLCGPCPLNELCPTAG